MTPLGFEKMLQTTLKIEVAGKETQVLLGAKLTVSIRLPMHSG